MWTNYGLVTLPLSFQTYFGYKMMYGFDWFISSSKI